MLTFILVLTTLVAIYWFWIRPILKSRPAFQEIYEKEDSFFVALCEKLKGIKQKLSSAIVIAASAAVSGYDFFTPIVSGVDVSSLAAKVPSWAWPLILISSPGSSSSCATLPTSGTRPSSPTRRPRPRRDSAMWSWLASLIGGPVITGLINAYKAKLDAANTQDRIASDLAAKEIEAEIEARREASAIIIAEQGRWYTAIIRPLLAFPIIIYFWKVIVWDKVLGLGTTDPITGMIADWTGMIITAYVGGRSIEKVARIFRR
jgi:hypothetical protein